MAGWYCSNGCDNKFTKWRPSESRLRDNKTLSNRVEIWAPSHRVFSEGKQRRRPAKRQRCCQLKGQRCDLPSFLADDCFCCEMSDTCVL